MRFEDVSSEMGYTAVLYQKAATPMPRRTGPMSLAYSSRFLSYSMYSFPFSRHSRKES